MGARLDAFANGAGQMTTSAGQRMSSAAAAGKDFAGSMGDVASFSGGMGKKALDIGINMAGNAAQKKIGQFQQGLGQVDLSNAGQSIQGGVQSVGSELMAPGSSGDYRAHEMVGRLKEAGRTIAGELDTFGKVAANAGNTMEPKGLSDGPYGPYQGDFNRSRVADDERLPGVLSPKKYGKLSKPKIAAQQAQLAQQAQADRDKKRKDAQEAARVKKYGPDKKAERDRKAKEAEEQRRKQRAEGAQQGPSGLEKLIGDPANPADPNAPATPAEGYVPPNPQGVNALFDPNAGLTPEQVAYRDAMENSDPDTPAVPNGPSSPQVPGTPFDWSQDQPDFGPAGEDPGTTSGPSGPKPTPSSPAAPAAEPVAAEPVAATGKEPVAPKDKPKTPKKTTKPKTKPKGGRQGGLPEGTVKRTAGKKNDPGSSPANNALFGIPPQDD